MLKVPFTKLHGDENDFILTWLADAPDADLPELARRICARTTGIGADGWMLVETAPDGLRTRLFNSDGTEPEISGNGTRCAAAFGLYTGAVKSSDFHITTAAGSKQLRLISRRSLRFQFEMDMGGPRVQELSTTMELAGQHFDATILDVGNPQCAVFVDAIPSGWRVAAAEAEAHPRFPKRSNVSFVRVLNRNAIEAVFYERGAGETRSSGTGSTGAGVAAILRKMVDSPLEIHTPAGILNLRWDESVYLTGPAEIIGEGSFFLDL